LAVSLFIETLRRKRYRLSTSLSYLKCVAHFGYWMQQEGMAASDINQLSVTRFIKEHLSTCDCPQPCSSSRGSSGAALSLLQRLMPAPKETRVPSNPVELEITRFEGFLREIKGLAPATLLHRLRHVRAFLNQCLGHPYADIHKLTPQDIDKMIESLTRDWRTGSRHVFCTDLRSYFRYRAMLGDDTSILVATLPVSANWSRRHPPKVLSEIELTSFENSFDLAKPLGLRDYAIARLLLDLGLRADEVAHLTLEQISWSEGIINIQRTKSQRAQQLPLPANTGRVLAHYLKEARPLTQSRLVFIRHRAAFGDPLSVAAIRNAMNRAFQRCGLSDRFCNTHVLRRSMATRLQRAGASIKEIADLLRHRDLNTGRAYARVDLESLRSVALPWQGRLA
jgi:integrase/recombinase XerD